MREEVISVDIVLPIADPMKEDVIETVIWEAGVQGFERHDNETFSQLVEEPYPLQAGATRWRVNVAAETDLEAAVERFRDELSMFPELSITAWMRDVTGYRTVWMQFFKPTQVSPRVMIHPPWDKPENACPIMIEIDPGMAFGTGTHETTQLCIKLLDEVGVPEGCSVLDVGTGSGILAIAAVKLGADSAVGVDFDPDAIREAIRNSETNGVGQQCAYRIGELEETDPKAEVVIANILPHVLIAISDGLISHTLPGGLLILSGILLVEEDRVREHFEAEGMKQVERVAKGDWCALAFRHA